MKYLKTVEDITRISHHERRTVIRHKGDKELYWANFNDNCFTLKRYGILLIVFDSIREHNWPTTLHCKSTSDENVINSVLHHFGSDYRVQWSKETGMQLIQESPEDGSYHQVDAVGY